MTADLNELVRMYEQALADAENHLRWTYAQLFLRRMREDLFRFNLKRHNVKISSGMGSACLTVNDEVWPPDGRFDHNMANILCELRRITSILDYRWADYIHGESLTHYKVY